MAGKKNAPKKIEDWEKHIADKHHKTMVVKISVICVSVIIIFLWTFALKNRFASADWNRAPEYELIKTAQEQWRDIETETIHKNAVHEADYDAVKIKINEIIEQMNTTTSINEEDEKIGDSKTNNEEKTVDNEIIPDNKEQTGTNSQINEDNNL